MKDVIESFFTLNLTEDQFIHVVEAIFAAYERLGVDFDSVEEFARRNCGGHDAFGGPPTPVHDGEIQLWMLSIAESRILVKNSMVFLNPLVFLAVSMALRFHLEVLQICPLLAGLISPALTSLVFDVALLLVPFLQQMVAFVMLIVHLLDHQLHVVHSCSLSLVLQSTSRYHCLVLYFLELSLVLLSTSRYHCLVPIVLKFLSIMPLVLLLVLRVVHCLLVFHKLPLNILLVVVVLNPLVVLTQKVLEDLVLSLVVLLLMLNHRNCQSQVVIHPQVMMHVCVLKVIDSKLRTTNSDVGVAILQVSLLFITD